MGSVAVIIPIADNDRRSEFIELGLRAQMSAYRQTVEAHEVLTWIGSSVSDARNRAANHSTAEWLIFLDADDTLDPNYIERMLEGTGDIRQPSTLGVYENGAVDDQAVLIPEKSLIFANYLIIGSMVRRSIFLDAGGFRDLPILEDWDLWIRCALLGASIGKCPGAIYEVHVRDGSRNTDLGTHGQTYLEIQQRYQDQWHAKGLP